MLTTFCLFVLLADTSPMQVLPLEQITYPGGRAYINVEVPTLPRGRVSTVILGPDCQQVERHRMVRALSSLGHRVVPIAMPEMTGDYVIMVTAEEARGEQAYGIPVVVHVEPLP